MPKRDGSVDPRNPYRGDRVNEPRRLEDDERYEDWRSVYKSEVRREWLDKDRT